jgi:hypothetical protein
VIDRDINVSKKYGRRSNLNKSQAIAGGLKMERRRGMFLLI